MRKNSRFTASVAEYVRHGLGDGVYVVREEMMVVFTSVMWVKT